MKILVSELLTGEVFKYEQFDVVSRKTRTRYELNYRIYTLDDYGDLIKVSHHTNYFDTKELALTWYKLYCEGN